MKSKAEEAFEAWRHERWGFRGQEMRIPSRCLMEDKPTFLSGFAAGVKAAAEICDGDREGCRSNALESERREMGASAERWKAREDQLLSTADEIRALSPEIVQ